MNRRQVIQIGSAALLLGGGALYTRYRWIPRRPRDPLPPVRELTQELCDGLAPETRERTCFPYDHPLRQYHNHGVPGAGLAITAAHFTRHQRGLLTDLLHAGLSRAGRERIPRQFFVNWPGVHLMRVAVFGDPAAPHYQVVLSGPHLNLRLGGASREGVAFGGPQVFGDQRGNGREGLPGNLYRYQLERAHALFEQLSPAQRVAATLARTPHQQQIEVRGESAALPGLPLGELSASARSRAADLLRGVLENYASPDAEYAWECVEAGGGVEALHVSYYAEGNAFDNGVCQVFRLEGPAAAYFFLGFPHVHAFLNVARDGERPLSVGRDLGTNPSRLEGVRLRRFFEAALRESMEADVGYYDDDSLAGELRSGPIRTGDIYVLESWQNRMVALEVAGRTLGGALRERLAAAGLEVDPARSYRVATTAFSETEHRDRIGPARRLETGALVRDGLVGYIERHGFPGA